MKLEINHRKRNEKKTITWRLNNMLLKNQWIKVKVASDSLQPHRLFRPRNSPGQNTGVCSLSPLQGIFPTQGSNPGLPHCRWILYQLSHKGSPGIPEWVTYSFPSVMFPTQASNQGLLHCRQILYQLSYEGMRKSKRKQKVNKTDKLLATLT